MRWYSKVISWVVLCGVSSEFCQNVSAQSLVHWLGEKVQEFSQGESPADVLEEFGEHHKFKLVFANDAVRSALTTGKMYGNVDGLLVKQLLTAICHSASTDGLLPWAAGESSLTFLDPNEFVTVDHGIGELRSWMPDPGQFRQAVTNSVNGVWESDKRDSNVGFGSILDLNSGSMKIRQTNRTQAEIRELFDVLDEEIQQGRSAKLWALRNRLPKALGRQTAIENMEVSVLDAFQRLLTKKHIPWLLFIPSSSDFDAESILRIAKGKHRVIDFVDVAVKELDLTIDLIGGILVMRVADQEFSRFQPRGYPLLSILATTVVEDLRDEAMASGHIPAELVESVGVLGPFLIVKTDFDSHRRIEAAINQEPEARKVGRPVVKLKPAQGDGVAIPTVNPPPALPAPANTATVGVVRLLSPKARAVLSNGDYTRMKKRTWAFDWGDVPNATRYQLFVKGATAQVAIINLEGILTSEWTDTRTGVVPELFLRNWSWKVRAFVNDKWTEWSDTRTFHVEEAR